MADTLCLVCGYPVPVTIRSWVSCRTCGTPLPPIYIFWPEIDSVEAPANPKG